MKEERVYLEHILQSIEHVEEYTAGGRALFETDRKTQDATLRLLQVLAESTQRLPSSLKATHPEIDWIVIARFRNALVHDYLGLDMDEVWETITIDLPTLKAAIQDMLEKHGTS